MQGPAENSESGSQSRSVLRQTTFVVGVAVVAANALTLLFYSIFFADRLLLDLVLTTIIVVVVGYPMGFLYIGQNVRLRRLAGQLDRLARTDDLTDLENRRSFIEKAGRALAEESHGGGALLYIDVDHFKRYNDTHGHGAGDTVLRQLGRAIRQGIRKSDIAGRIGGEEFAVYLPGAGLDAARKVAGAIRARLAEIAGEGAFREPVTVSIGMAVGRAGRDMEALMRIADANLYTAKKSGRDQVVDDVARAA